jgi:hypothetical protein
VFTTGWNADTSTDVKGATSKEHVVTVTSFHDLAAKHIVDVSSHDLFNAGRSSATDKEVVLPSICLSILEDSHSITWSVIPVA